MTVINVGYHSRERPQFDPRALVAAGPRISVDVLPPVVVEKWAASSNVRLVSAHNVQALLDTGHRLLE
ncbi:MAG: hypothetical protein GSR79_00350 [Desulfurococcales archaeon]|nr:hypothetical protein [Desulfurococcales archaeon]